MDNFEQRAMELIKKFWHVYLIDRSMEEFGQVFSQVSSDIVLIGTGKHELYEGIANLEDTMSNDLGGTQDVEFEIVDEWYSVQRITETVCVVYGTFWAREKTDSRRHIVADMDTRFTVVCRAEGDKIIICNLHHSTPSIDQQSGEFYPKTITERANEAMERYAQLESRVQHDQLTGLYNRDYATSFIEHYLSEQKACVLLVIDIDNFKAVNDTFGHLQGDEVLKRFAGILGSTFRKGDMIARVGGDEFVVLVKQTDPETSIDSRAKQVIAEFSNYLSASKGLESVSCSIGAAVAPQDGEDFTALFSAADQALYDVKFHGKSNLAYFSR